MPSLGSTSALSSRVNLHWFTSMSRVPGQTFKNVILVFSLYLYLFLVATLLHTKEDWTLTSSFHCHFLQLLFSALELLLLFPTNSVFSTKICHGHWLSGDGLTWVITPTSTRTWPSASGITFWFWYREVDGGSIFIWLCWETLMCLVSVAGWLWLRLTGAEGSQFHSDAT